MADNGGRPSFYERNRALLNPEALLIYFVLAVLAWLVTLGLARGFPWCASMLSRMSGRFSDNTYRLAAEDPNQGVVMVIGMTLSLVLLLSYYTLTLAIRSRIPDKRRVGEDRTKYVAWQRRRFIRTAVIGLGSVLAMAFIQVQSSVAARIWQTWHQNLSIAAPYIAEHDRLMLESRFRLIQSKADFDALQAELFEVGKKNGVPIRSGP